MDESITFEKVVKFEMTFEKFKILYDYPSEEMYKEIWEKMVTRANKKKYGKIIYNCDIGIIEHEEPEVKKRGRKPFNEPKKRELKTDIDLEEEEAECLPLAAIVGAAVRDGYDEAKTAFEERRQKEIEELLKKPTKRKLRTITDE